MSTIFPRYRTSEPSTGRAASPWWTSYTAADCISRNSSQETLNHVSHILYPEPETRNLKPGTRNPEPQHGPEMTPPPTPRLQGVCFSVLWNLMHRGTSFIRNSPPPWDHHRTLGIVLLQGPGRGVFRRSQVPLYWFQHAQKDPGQILAWRWSHCVLLDCKINDQPPSKNDPHPQKQYPPPSKKQMVCSSMCSLT